ncbi:unnamed protein product [Haemonchus placei]|uniref:AAA_12 domain-containing protein n=1 Tax=Haemonchus placei TaxID=6290 RepID=A0A0N4WXQ7_HAEPC|nr:unnamed protein product [Haemonchus placei]
MQASSTAKKPQSPIKQQDNNAAEAEVCRQIVTSFLRKNVQPASNAVIIFYKEQSQTLAHFASASFVDLHTVDSAQGREKDVVILLTTQTGFDPWRVPQRFATTCCPDAAMANLFWSTKSLWQACPFGLVSPNGLMTAGPLLQQRLFQISWNRRLTSRFPNKR